MYNFSGLLGLQIRLLFLVIDRPIGILLRNVVLRFVTVKTRQLRGCLYSRVYRCVPLNGRSKQPQHETIFYPTAHSCHQSLFY